MKKLLCIILSLTLLLSLTSYVYAKGDNLVGAELLGDYETGDIVHSKNIDTEIGIASITKLMTYIVTMEAVKNGQVHLRDYVVISDKVASSEGSTFNMKKGEKVKLTTLIESMLIVSANDSCIAIAEHVAGSEKRFLKLMNKKAKDMGLDKSNFVSVNGYPKSDIENTMTAREVFKLSRYVIKTYPQILDITNKKELNLPERNYKKESTNPLVGLVKGVDGLKTGYTDKAGRCLVATMKIGKSKKEGHRLISIVMGAKDDEMRKTRSIEVLNIGKKYRKINILNKNKAITSIELDKSKDNIISIYPSKDVSGLIKENGKVSIEKTIDTNIKLPITKGTIIGTAKLRYGDVIKNVDLVVNKNIKKANIVTLMFRSIRSLFSD